MDSDTRRELDAVKAALKETTSVAYDALNGLATHEAVQAEQFKAIIERLDRPGKWFGRAFMAGSGTLALIHIFDWLRGVK